MRYHAVNLPFQSGHAISDITIGRTAFGQQGLLLQPNSMVLCLASSIEKASPGLLGALPQ